MTPATPPALPYLGDADLVDGTRARAAAIIRQRRTGGALLNLDRMLLHSPAFAAGWSALLGAVRTQLTLDAGLREMVICAIARLNAADYEWHQHIGEWRAAGARPDQEAVLLGAPEGWLQDPAFSVKERLALDLTLQSTRSVAVDPALVAALTAMLGAEATVELVGTVAAYNMVSRFLVALGVSAEGEVTPPG